MFLLAAAAAAVARMCSRSRCRCRRLFTLVCCAVRMCRRFSVGLRRCRHRRSYLRPRSSRRCGSTHLLLLLLLVRCCGSGRRGRGLAGSSDRHRCSYSERRQCCCMCDNSPLQHTQRNHTRFAECDAKAVLHYTCTQHCKQHKFDHTQWPSVLHMTVDCTLSQSARGVNTLLPLLSAAVAALLRRFQSLCLTHSHQQPLLLCLFARLIQLLPFPLTHTCASSHQQCLIAHTCIVIVVDCLHLLLLSVCATITLTLTVTVPLQH